MFYFLLFLAAASVVPLQGEEFLAGVKGHLLGMDDRFVVRDVSSLPTRCDSFAKTVEITGIPDYGSMIRFPSREGILTCFRMTGFENRLFVSTTGSMTTPEEISKLLLPRSMEGRLVSLKKSKLAEPLIRGFRRSHRIQPHEQAFVLLEGESPIPSRGKTLLLSSCLLLCVFFLYRTIKG